MEKSALTRKMAWIAFYLEIGKIGLQILLILVLPALGLELSAGTKLEIPTGALCYQVLSECLMLPFAFSCLWCAKQKQELTENRAMLSLLLPCGLWFLAELLHLLANWFGYPILYRFYDTAVVGSISVMNTYRGLLNILPLQTAALVIICCASAIELYILKHPSAAG